MGETINKVNSRILSIMERIGPFDEKNKRLALPFL